MKKIINSFLIVFVFCLTFTFGGFFFDNLNSVKETNAAKESAEDFKIISNETELLNYIKNYNNSSVNDKIRLTADIDMAKSEVLKNTIGTVDNPFSGIFDGRGYSIKNFKVDASVEGVPSENQYAGLFGVISNATIKNLGIGGEIVLTTNVCSNAYVGGIVAKSITSNIENIQFFAKVNYMTDYNSNLSFGTIVGYAENTTLKNIIARAKGFGELTFSRDDNKIIAYGGLVGQLNNSKIIFAVTSLEFNINILDAFIGEFDFGGIVGRISQGGSQITNLAVDNTYNISRGNSVLSTIHIGEIGGSISYSNVPKSGNLSYIYFKNNSLADFGDSGNYKYKNEASSDNINITKLDLNTLVFENTNPDVHNIPTYFFKQDWHPIVGGWDFKQTWYVNSELIYLQSFYSNFELGISTSMNQDVIIVKSQIDTSNLRYGDSYKIDFAFKNIEETNGEDVPIVVGSMQDYYELSQLVLNKSNNEKNKVNIVNVSTDENPDYKIFNSELYSIETHGNEFSIIINSINLETSGFYFISTIEKEFKVNINSRLYLEENGEEVLSTDEIPGYVYYAEGTNTNDESLKLTVGYNQNNKIETKVKPNTPNVFVGWYMVDNTTGDKKISDNYVLEFTFGKGEFKKDCEIYAKYKDNACVLTINIDDGILKVALYNDAIVLSEPTSNVPVSKNDTIKFNIYVKEYFAFDEQIFVRSMDAFKNKDSEKNFCEFVEKNEIDGISCYTFTLNMSALAENYLDALTLNIETEPDSSSTSNMIWYIVGGVGGAVVLGVVIFLIIFFKRRGGGGSARVSSFSKKDYKNMYF